MSLETVETLYTFGPARLRRAGDSSPTTVTSHPDVSYVMLLLLLLLRSTRRTYTAMRSAAVRGSTEQEGCHRMESHQ